MITRFPARACVMRACVATMETTAMGNAEALEDGAELQSRKLSPRIGTLFKQKEPNATEIQREYIAGKVLCVGSAMKLYTLQWWRKVVGFIYAWSSAYMCI